MLRPKQAIRRFDVFAEYHRLERLRQGMPADEAKGYGLWLAKVPPVFGMLDSMSYPRFSS